MRKHAETATALFQPRDGRHHAQRAAQERAMARAAAQNAARRCHIEMALYHEAMSGSD